MGVRIRRNTHEGYITWEEYQYNMEILAQNTNKKRPVVRGSVRGGEALLGGLLRCGHCGRKLIVRYQGRNGTHKRYECSSKRGNETGKACMSFGGFRVDRAVTDSLLDVLSPIGLEASLEAMKNINHKSDSVKRQRELELEQARYEALRARRQYNAVDPDNRLVASTLEKDWNDALLKVARLENEINAMGANTPPLSRGEETEIRELSQNLPRVWNDPRCSLNLKKRIIRTVIKEIIVYLEAQKIKLIIHWEGGEHTDLEVLKNKYSNSPLKTDIDTKKIISELARSLSENTKI